MGPPGPPEALLHHAGSASSSSGFASSSGGMGPGPQTLNPNRHPALPHEQQHSEISYFLDAPGVDADGDSHRPDDDRINDLVHRMDAMESRIDVLTQGALRRMEAMESRIKALTQELAAVRGPKHQEVQEGGCIDSPSAWQ